MKVPVLVLIGLAACATPYQPMGLRGGYADQVVAPGVFAIEVRGNGYTSAATLQTYALRRGFELCNMSGYPHVRLMDASMGTEVSTTPVTYNTDINARTYGNTTYGSATTYQTGGYQIRKHHVEVKAVCMTEEEYYSWSMGLRQQMLQRQGF